LGIGLEGWCLVRDGAAAPSGKAGQRPLVPEAPLELVAPGVVLGGSAPVPVLEVPGAAVLGLVVPEPLGMVEEPAPVLPLMPLDPDEPLVLPDWPLVPDEPLVPVPLVPDEPLEPDWPLVPVPVPVPPAPLELLEPLVPMLPLPVVPPVLPDAPPMLEPLDEPLEPAEPLEPLLPCLLECFFLECLVDELPVAAWSDCEVAVEPPVEELSLV